MRYKLWLMLTMLLSSNFLNAQLKYVDNEHENFLKILLVGDVTLNNKVLEASYSENTNSYDFQHVFHYIRPILNLGDIVVANVNNTFGTSSNFLDKKVNNAPKEYGLALKYAGFNLLMNANSSAVQQDIDQWKANKLFLDSLRINQLGTYEHDADRSKRNPTIIEKEGIKVAFINYMDGLPYYRDVSPIVNGVQEDVVKKDILKAINNGADYTIIYVNWGNELQTRPNVSQRNLARLCIQNGADIVVGTNPKMVLNVDVGSEIIEGDVKKKVVMYSLGDFLSASSEPLFNSSCIVEIVLKKDKRTNKVSLVDDGFLSTYTAMYEQSDKVKYTIMPVSQIEKQNVSVPISNTEKHWMRSATEKVRHNFSGRMDEIEYELNDEIVDDVAEVLTVTRRPLNEDKTFKLEINNHLLTALDIDGAYEELASQPIINEGIVYKVQFLSLRRDIPIDTDFYKHLRGYETYKEGEYYHYVIGNFKNLKRANDFCLDVKRNGHKYAYVVAFENGEKISKRK